MSYGTLSWRDSDEYRDAQNDARDDEPTDAHVATSALYAAAEDILLGVDDDALTRMDEALVEYRAVTGHRAPDVAVTLHTPDAEPVGYTLVTLPPACAALLAELENIANARWRSWDAPLNTAEDFVTWAQSRASHTLAAFRAAQPGTPS